MRRLLLLLLVSISLAGCRKDGAVRGSVRFDGDIPKPKVLQITPGRLQGCANDTRVMDDLLIDSHSRGVSNVLVRIMDVKQKTESEKKDVEVSLSGCRFTPSTFILPPGSNLIILNPGLLPHNIHWVPLDGINNPVSRMMPQNQERVLFKGSKHFAEPELIQLQCDIHPWMKSLFAVHDPRFAAITNSDGRFEFKHVPPGKYKVYINHITLGEQEADIEIKAGSTTKFNPLFHAGK